MRLWNTSRFLTALILTVLFFGNVPLLGAAGKYSGDFLRVPVYSRGASLGGAWVAVAEGTGALYYNPAGVGRIASELSFTHSELYQGLRLENLSFTIPVGSGTGFGCGVSYLGYGGIDGYDLSGASTGEISASSLVFTISGSQRLSENFYIGAAAKPILERLGEYSAQTVTFDLGLLAEFGQFSFGLQYANLGGSLEFIAEKSPLPTALRVGAAYRTLGGSIVALSGSREGSDLYRLGSGLEYRYNSFLVARAGYNGLVSGSDDNSTGVTFGMGFELSQINLDYSYHPGQTLGGTHQVTAGLRFGQ